MEQKTINITGYMSVADFMEKYSITRPTVYNWIKEGKVSKKKIGYATLVKMAS